MTATTLFRAAFGSDPAGVWSAPGRVNLIGEHTDYNNGPALPFAIDRRAALALAPGRTDRHRVISAQRGQQVQSAAPDELTPGGPHTRGWAGYPFGVLWALGAAGHEVPPLDLALDSAVPAGAGLSSSAAVECAAALAVSDHLKLALDGQQLARLAQRAENEFVGVPCGLMDQTAATAGTRGHALLFDAATGCAEQIPFDPDAVGVRVLVIDTRVRHSLADGRYAQRRAECETAARALGFRFLSELPTTGLDDALRSLPPVLRRRTRHVITEIDRVHRVAGRLRDGSVDRVGPELTASHESLRDDYEVSCPELDLAVAEAQRAGALGARMVGGGFGGSVLALVAAGQTAAVRHAVTAAFEASGFARPQIERVTPSDGAARDR